jgi:hypothetical protein
MFLQFKRPQQVSFFILLVTCMHTGIYAQTNTMPTIGTVIPVSPNAASLGKYGEIPVGYSTGIPNINVPVYEITSGSLKIPISLSYHAGGIRVEEIASWVGLGWSLNAGGVITRQVRGLADESGGGYIYHSGDVSDYINSVMNSTQKQAYKDDITDGNTDSQQDIYVYNLGGESGKFFLKPNGDILTIPFSKNKIAGGGDSWIVTDVNGTNYYFTAKETTTTTPVIGGSIGPTAYIPTVTAWYLTKIVNAAATDSINLVYENMYTSMYTGMSQTKYYLTGSDPSCSGKDLDDTYAYSTIVGKRLIQINFKNGTVGFNKRASGRTDYVGDSALQSIEIYNVDSSFYRKVEMYQSFVAGNSSYYGTTDDEKNRMFLDSVNVFDLSQKVERYKFVYNQSEALPSRKSFSQDHWGYYNAADNGYDFVPTTNIPVSGGGHVPIAGADRNPDTLNNQLGILTSIKYPTGGRTEFEYQTNTISNLQSNQDIIIGYDYFSIGYILGTYTYSDSLTIDHYFGDSTVNAVISINNGGGDCALGANLACPLVNITGPYGYSASIYTGGIAVLPSGTYHVTVDLTGVTDPDILNNFYVQITWPKSALSDTTYRYNAPAGGLRIKKITNYISENVKAGVKQYKYSFPDSVNHSSGFLLSFPEYTGEMLIHKKEIIDPGGANTIIFYDCPYATISSGSNYPLQTTQGSYVGYKYVQELLGENGEFGKNEYTFSAPDTYNDIVNTDFPFAPATSLDWKRGQMLRTKNYRYNSAGQTYTLVQDKINTYEDNATDVYYGLKVGQNEFFQGYSPGFTRVYGVSQFNTESGWFRLSNDTTRIYSQDNPSNYTETVTAYNYGSNHYQPTAVTTTNSKGETVAAYMKYPLDYTSLTAADALTAGIRNLQNNNMVSPVIEKYTQIGSNSRTTQATLTSYKPTIPFPDTIYTTELTGATTSFSPTTVSGGSIIKSAVYQPQVSFNKYDSYGNIVEQQKLKDAKHAYLWDYAASYPIAEVANADSGNIAYTSFETGVTGNWSVSSGSPAFVTNTASPTGKRYYTLTGTTLQKTGLNSGTTYIVSYWSSTGTYYTVSGTVASSKTGASIGGWTYCEHEVTGAGTISVSGTGSIDELRLYPKGALMTTYTYLPLAGMTSQCDAGNKITYYEYDSLGRLLQVKDEKRKVLKTFNYQYQ